MKKQREKSSLTDCEGCGLKDYGYVPPQLVSQPQFNILWVGQAGGSTEDVTGVPFTGPAGRMLWRLMKEAGFDKNKQNITNAVGCVPPLDRKPTDSEISCCHNKLCDEIQSLEPEIIIALGDTASQALIGKKTITKLRGQTFQLLSSFNYECDVFCTLHPSFVMRQRQWIDTMVDDLSSVHRKLLGEEELEVSSSSSEVSFNINPTSQELISYLERDEVTAFDLETTGLNPRLDSIIGCSFSSGSDAIAVCFADGEKFEIMKKFFEDSTKEKVTQNGSFDCAFLKAIGVEVKGLCYDTRLAEHLLNSDLPTDLQFLRKKYTNIASYKPSRLEMKNLTTMSIDKVNEFCCWDSFTTREVMLKQLPLLSAKQREVLRNIYVPLIFTLNKMERKGVKVDVEKLALMYAQHVPMAEEIADKYFTPLGLNPNSPKQMANYWGIESTKKFSTKMTKTDPEKYIDFMIRRGHPEAEKMQALLDYRAIMKQASTALMGVYKRLEDGRIHTNYQPEGTGTGRISSKNPNLQNIQKPYRCIYIADDEEHCLLEADYSQLELVVAALLGREKTLLEQIKQGVKPHHVLGKVMFNRDWNELTELEKLREKAVLFGTMGGRGYRSISREFGVSEETARSWQEMCVTQYPGLLDYLNETISMFNATGKIITAFGTTRTVSTIPQAMNNRFQGSASFVTLTTLNELDKAGFDLRLTVHDSIVMHCPKKELEEVARAAKQIVERPIKELSDWCFQAKYEYGDNWYELNEVKL